MILEYEDKETLKWYNMLHPSDLSYVAKGHSEREYKMCL